VARGFGHVELAALLYRRGGVLDLVHGDQARDGGGRASEKLAS